MAIAEIITISEVVERRIRKRNRQIEAESEQ